MNEDKLREKILRLIRPHSLSARTENWIVQTLLSAVERETDAKILHELERLSK